MIVARLVIVLLVVAASGATATVAPASSAHPGRWAWTYPLAESMLEDEYQTADPRALGDANEDMAQARAIGSPGAIEEAQRAVEDAGRAAEVAWAHCEGVGHHEGKLYRHFNCRIHLSSWASTWEATKRVQLHVTGRSRFVVTPGYRR